MIKTLIWCSSFAILFFWDTFLFGRSNPDSSDCFVLMDSTVYHFSVNGSDHYKQIPPTMTCGCPCGRVIKNGQMHNPLTLRNASVSVQLHMLGKPHSVQLQNVTTIAAGRQYQNGLATECSTGECYNNYYWTTRVFSCRMLQQLLLVDSIKMG